MLRVKINLSATGDEKIPFNYNYSLYFALRSIVLKELQAKKPKLFKSYQQNFPEFTFSYLRIPHREIQSGFIWLKSNYLSLFVSSPDELLMQNLISGLEKQKQLALLTIALKVTKVEVLAEPEWKEKMEFTMLSPLLVLKKEEKRVKFLLATSLELDETIRNGIIQRYNRFFRTEKRSPDFRFYLNQDYLLSSKDLHKLITIRDVHYKTIFAPFFLEGDKDLIRFAYFAGLGDKTNFGLGMFAVKS